MQQQKKGKPYHPARKSKGFESDDSQGQLKLTPRRRKRDSWRFKKTQLERMNIDDLKNYISDTEY